MFQSKLLSEVSFFFSFITLNEVKVFPNPKFLSYNGTLLYKLDCNTISFLTRTLGGLSIFRFFLTRGGGRVGQIVILAFNLREDEGSIDPNFC